MMHCQKCRTPLQLDESLDDLNPAAYDLLVATHSQQTPKTPATRTLHSQEGARKSLYNQVSRNAGPATFKRHSGPGRGGADGQARDNGAMSYVFLTQSQVAPHPSRRHLDKATRAPAHDSGLVAATDNGEDASKSHEIERITKLFEIQSARSDIDHPVCVECADLLVDEMRKKLDAITRVRDAYVAYLKEELANAPTEEEARAQEERCRKAREEEQAAKAELLALEREKATLDEELLALEEESRELDRDEEKFWRERNAFASKLADFHNERDSINSKFDHDSRLLEKLQRTNVYNDTFTISHDGTFATINGLRLGRLSSKPVDWPEINAAWGHALLLLVTVADKLGYRFEGYEPQPLGSTSRIVRLDPVSPSSSRVGGHRSAPPLAPKRHVLDLYSSGDVLPLGLTFLHRKFDSAMVAFLELLRQLGAHVHARMVAEGRPKSVPYQIDGDRIGDERIGHVSIKLGMAQDEAWTRACKWCLTYCKFLLAYASDVSSPAGGRTAPV